jgi:hypothetical protein
MKINKIQKKNRINVLPCVNCEHHINQRLRIYNYIKKIKECRHMDNFINAYYLLIFNIFFSSPLSSETQRNNNNKKNILHT